ncbi:uncharacterized protein [Asterias amurensis]|uniref:uncharacterized protein n=1 Tax=Asterias amurensis TaxID=7602 RepID=UPI003AB75B26
MMIFGRLWAVLAMLCTSRWVLLASTTDLYPNPQKDLYRCGQRGRTSWICDPDQILSFKEAIEVNNTLTDIRQETKCACANQALCTNGTGPGYRVAVAVMSFIPTTRSQKITAKSYATFLREQEWKYGSCDDDVVIVVSKLEKKVAVSIGDNAAKMLSADVMKDILSDTNEYFQKENFSDGLLEFIGLMKLAFDNDYKLIPPFPVWTVVQMAMAALFVLICFFSMYICRKLYS